MIDRPVNNINDWTSAFPVGNGRLGAMSFGGVGVERILINEDTIWEGPPVPEMPEDAAVHVKKARELWFGGKYAEAQAEMKSAMGQPIEDRSYQPAGWLKVDFGGEEAGRLSLTSWELKDGDEYSPVDLAKEKVAVTELKTYRCRFEVGTEDVAKWLDLTLGPIDDRSKVVLNGEQLGTTTQWDKPTTFSVKGKLRAGTNELLVTVENIGGEGHPMSEAWLSAGAPAGYSRVLDLESGVVTTTLADGVKREHFVSAPDKVAVFHYEAGSQPLDLTVGFTKQIESGDIDALDMGSGIRMFLSQAGTPDHHPGTKYAVGVVVMADGEAQPGLSARGAKTVDILVAVSTDYNRDDPHVTRIVDLAKACQRNLMAASRRSYSILKTRAADDHAQLFDRCTLMLNGASMEDMRPINERLAAYRAGAADPGLEALMFEYGRYLLIGSSRPGGVANNLQGIWNPWESAPWNSDWHININLQMNYWPACATGLADLEEPYWCLQERLRTDGGRKFAETLGCRGTGASHTTDVWTWSAMNGQPVWGAWVMGGAWCATDMMEAYRYTGDKKYLREKAWPVLRDCSLFLVDWMVPDPVTGKLVSGPTTSPENTFLVDGKGVSVGMGNSMDQEIAWQCLSDTLEAAAALGIKDKVCLEFAETLAKLARPKIGEDGRLMEWSKPFAEAEPGHRHISHAFGLHPGNEFQVGSPEFDAIQKSVEYRLSHGGGHTGWSRAWIINLWARLHKGETAYENVQALLQKSVIGALMDNHPPFQIDGNFGFTAGVAEMLVQSHESAPDGMRVLRLFPAKPADWKSVELDSLTTRGGMKVRFYMDGGVQRAEITATRDATFNLILGDGPVDSGGRVQLKAGQAMSVTLKD